MSRQSNRVSVATCVVVIALIVSPRLLAQQTTTKEVKAFEVVSVDGNVLVVRGAEGTREITVPDDFRFTVGGKQVPVNELKPGMKGRATITTTTTERPVSVTEVKSGEVVKAMGHSVIVRTAEGFKSFSQGEMEQRGIRIFKEGKAVDLSDLHEGDKLSATIVTTRPPEILTARQVEATLESARAAAPAQAASAPPAAAAAAKGGPGPATTEAPAATAVAPAVTPAAETAAVSQQTGTASGGGLGAPALWMLGILVAAIAGYFVIRSFRSPA
jgi:hypothetical protein